jgi:hypothetical protein
MRHARDQDLDRLEPLLAQIRTVAPLLKEKKRGVFYLKGRSFLHFHEDPKGLFADVGAGDGKDFERLQVDAPAGAVALLARVAAASVVSEAPGDKSA